MNKWGIDEMKSLIQTGKDICISIVFSTYRGGADLKQNRIRFKSLMQKAKLLLIQKGWKSPRAEEFLSPLKSLLQDEIFWQHPSEGLAFFLSTDFLRYYHLPIHMEEQVLIDQRFLIRPLVPLLSGDPRFYVLAISEGDTRLLQGSILGIVQLPVKTIPRNLEYAMRFNDPERQLQLHTQTPRMPGARAAAIFHGHGVGIDDEKDDLLEYCRQVDRGLHPLLKEEHAPLVIAAVDALFYTYAKVNTYPHLLHKHITGNPDLLSDAELWKLAWSVVASNTESKTDEIFKSYIELVGSGLVTNNVEEILKAARAGRIQHLLVNSERVWWGQYFEETNRIESHDTAQPEDIDIANFILTEALKTGAVVHELKPPSTDYPCLLAIYRY